jgi:TetR/AcrR family transcriptional regulator
MPPQTGQGRLTAPDRRHQLLETALDFFSRKGFEGATTKEIAAAAGVTEAIVFRHFLSKQALYQSVLDHCHGSSKAQEFLSTVRAFMQRKDDAGFFRYIFSAILRSFREDPRMERLLLFAALEGDEQGLAHAREVSNPIYELLREYILSRQREGKLRNMTPSIILIAISGMAKQYAMLTQMFGYPADMPDEQVADAMTAILMAGIHTRPSRARK